MVKYLGELYNYRLVESSIIFKVLYTLITYGINYDGNLRIYLTPKPAWNKYFFYFQVNESATNDLMDPCDNFFRVRLVCIMLDTCGQYFDRGNTKKKLDCFLIYFQVKLN